MTKFKFWLFFVSILVLGIFLRIYKFGQIPESLYWDEVAIFLDARSVAQTGLDIHGRPWFQLMYPSYGDYKLPVYIWFSAISIKFLGANDWVIRVPSLLAGIGTIITIGLIEVNYFLQKKLKLYNFAQCWWWLSHRGPLPSLELVLKVMWLSFLLDLLF